MPKIVNRDARRAQIVQSYLNLVARDGIEQASSRALATEAGISSGALWHYFDSFDEVLFVAFQKIFDDTNARIADVVAEARGLTALTAMLREILPLSKVTHDEALVAVSFWGRVPSNPRLGTFQSEADQLWRRSFVRHLAEAQDDGEVTRAARIDVLADTLLVLCIGQQVEHVLHTEVADPGRQWTLVSFCLLTWATPSGRDHQLFAPHPSDSLGSLSPGTPGPRGGLSPGSESRRIRGRSPSPVVDLATSRRPAPTTETSLSSRRGRRPLRPGGN